MYTVDTDGSANVALEGLLRVMVKLSVSSSTVSSLIVNTMSTDSASVGKVAVPATGERKSTPPPVAVPPVIVVSETNHMVLYVFNGRRFSDKLDMIPPLFYIGKVCLQFTSLFVMQIIYRMSRRFCLT